MIEILPNENDDANFIKIVSQVLNSSISFYKPTEIFIVQIDHWFDVKWLGFSGQTLGVIPVGNGRLTVPAFNPNRVVNETFYKKANNSFIKSVAGKLHTNKRSSDNLHNFLDKISESGLFVWYSGDTIKLDKGSLMIYWTNPKIDLPSRQHINDWYVSFQKQTDWQSNKLKGISQSEFAALLENKKTEKVRKVLSPHLANKSDAKKFIKAVED